MAGSRNVVLAAYSLIIWVRREVIFIPRGLMKFTTETYRPGTPRFHKAIYNDGPEWGAWRFYGDIPLSLANPIFKEILVRMEVIEDWDPPQM